MAPAFADLDMAAIISAFPPPLPSKDRPSVIRSLSGSHLRDSRKILASLRKLLATTKERVPVAQLPIFLGVKETDWILECFDNPALRLSRDRSAILPEHQLELLQNDLVAKLVDGFVDQASLSIQYDISRESLETLVRKALKDDDEDHPTLQTLELDGKAYWYLPRMLQGTIAQVSPALRGAGSEKLDVSAVAPDIPADVLHWIVRGQIESGIVEGKNVIENGRAVFVPAGCSDDAQSNANDAQSRRVQDALAILDADDFVNLQAGPSTNSIIVQVSSQHEVKTGSRALVQLELRDRSTSLMTQDTFDKALQDITTRARNLAIKSWNAGLDVSAAAVLASPMLLEKGYDQILSHQILYSESRKHVKAAVAQALADLTAMNRKRFFDLLSENALRPLQLYINGVNSIQDPALKERLDGFVAENVLTHITPAGMQRITDSKLRPDKNLSQDGKKFATAISACRSCAAIEAEVSKFNRKQKLEHPSIESLIKARQEILDKKLASMSKMKRGSDMLQNTIWILLANAAQAMGVQALFVSSGKDVSRMIKLFQSLSDDKAVGEKLEQWRDKLKAGEERKEDLEAMREMARKAVDEMASAPVDGSAT